MKSTMSRTYHHGKRHFVASSPWNEVIQHQAQAILESDANFNRNYHSLTQRIAQGKVPEAALRRIHPSLVAESFRRRNLNLPATTARRMATLVSI